MKTKLYQPIRWLVLCAIAIGCNSCRDEDPTPEKVCKLLTDGQSQTIYEYDSKYKLIRLTNNFGSRTYNYDKKGFLIEEIRSDGKAIKYEYNTGLLSKITYPEGSFDIEKIYEYDAQQKLSKYIEKTKSYTDTKTYSNGKQVSYLTDNNNGRVTQPYQFRDGHIIKWTLDNNIYVTFIYDVKGRQIQTQTYVNGKNTGYTSTTYQNGLEPKEASPDNFFKGFPEEIKNIKPDGLKKSLQTYRWNNNVVVMDSEVRYEYVLNSKGYPTVVTETYSSRNSVGTWVTGNSSKITYAYFNCEE